MDMSPSRGNHRRAAWNTWEKYSAANAEPH